MKGIYGLFLNGTLAPDTHLFVFREPLSAVVTLLLFSQALGRTDLVLRCLGNIDEQGNIIPDNVRFCDFDSSLDVSFKLYNELDDKESNPFNPDYINRLHHSAIKAEKEKLNITINDDDNTIEGEIHEW